MSTWTRHPHLALALLHQRDLRDQAAEQRMAAAARRHRRRIRNERRCAAVFPDRAGPAHDPVPAGQAG